MTRWRLVVLASLVVAGCGLSQPHGPRSSASAVRRADAAFQRGDYAEAILLYRAHLDGRPPDDVVVQVTYRMAASYHRLGRQDEAAAAIEDLRGRFPDGQWPTVFALYGDIEHARRRNVSALLWWERAYSIGSDADRGQLSARMNSLVDEMSDEERRQARPLAGTDFVRRALSSTRRAPPRRTETPTPLQSPTPTPTPGPESARIGLLLPLSGRHRAVGVASLDGARIAVAHDEDLVPTDTHGTAGGGVAAYEALLADASIVAIVGPLGSDETSSVSRRAGTGGVSLLPLSQSEATASPFVLQTAMTRSLQAQTLAAFAVRRLGLRRFAVLHPRDAYGSRFSELFRQAATAEGGRVAGAVVYAPGQTEFASEVDQLRGLDQSAPIEAVFIPDSAATVALLAPEVRRELPQIQLLGSSEWNEAAILAGVAHSLEGAIFVDGFYADSARAATRAFVDKFRQRYGRRPGVLEAQAHDATALVEMAVGRGAFTRQEIQLVLESFGPFEGAGGTMEISGGVVRRQLFLLRFRGGTLEEISW